MKRLSSLVLVLVLGAGSLAWAQIVPGKRIELSTSAYLSSVKYKDADESTTMINIPLRVAFYIYKGLAIEPEMLLTLISYDEDSTTGILASGNLSYNFVIKGNAVPFILAGVGYGNGQELLGFTSDLETGIMALHFGAGIKLLFSQAAAIRLEYRFINYSGEKIETYSYWGHTYSYTLDYGRNDHKIMLGISIFL